MMTARIIRLPRRHSVSATELSAQIGSSARRSAAELPAQIGASTIVSAPQGCAADAWEPIGAAAQRVLANLSDGGSRGAVRS